jgi:uncharacterized protein YceH (UPF0502 family)
MLHLTPAESRVLGVLVEKATTTPEQYPLSLNALTSGCNQKNNRDPVLAISEDETFDAIESLRGKGLSVRVDMAGSRVHRYKHTAGDALHARGGELAILAELLLRGPQTLGELRGRATRMHPMESLDVAKQFLDALMNRPEPLVKQLPPAPGTRAERFVQLLCPDLHPIDATTASASPAPSGSGAATSSSLAQRVEKLEADVTALRQTVNKLAEALGEPSVPSPAAPGEGQDEG